MPTSLSRYPFLSATQTGYGNWPGSAEGKPNPASNIAQLTTDTPTFNAGLGGYVNLRTGKPWTGKISDGTYVSNGKKATDPNAASAAAIDPNDVSKRFQAVDVVKDPAVSSATDDLLASFKKGAADSLKGFDDYLKQFKDAAGTATAASKAAATQADTTAATMQGAQRDYSSALSTDISKLDSINASGAAAERGIVKQANDLLPQYDQAGQNIADRQLAEVVKNLSRYKLGTGTPRSLGSDESQILARGAADVLLPLEQSKIQRRYDILNNLALPVERGITSRATAGVNFDQGAQGSIYGSTQQTSMAVQSLKDAVAKQDWATALQIMQVPEIANRVQQQILQGDTSLLGVISQLRDSSHYRGLQDKLGVNLSQPQYFSPGDLPFPSPSRYPGRAPMSDPALGPNAPIQVGPGAPSSRYPTSTTNSITGNNVGGWIQSNGVWYNTITGETKPMTQPGGGLAPSAPSRYTVSPNMPDVYYDNATGLPYSIGEAANA